VGAAATPLPPHYEWKEPAQPYNTNKETLDYPLLEETYKKVYKDLFDILLTTPTPPPTPIPTPTSVPSGSTSPTPEGGGGKSVVINEVNWGGTVKVGSAGQWIELYNYGSSTVDLNKWGIEDSTQLWTISLSSSTINSGEYFVLAGSSANNPTGDERDFEYDTKSYTMGSSGDRLVLHDANGDPVDSVSCNSGWAAGATSYSMERYDPEVEGCSSSNWKNAVDTYGGLSNYGTPGKVNSDQKPVSASGKSASGAKGAGAGPAGAATSSTYRTLMDFADWIDFQNGNYFKLYEWDLTDLDPNYALFDYLPNCAFIYLTTGYKPTGDYYKEKLLELIRDKSFDWGGEETCRYIADIAESYLAMVQEGFFSEEEREEIKKKFYGLAIGQREYENAGNYGQGVICGLNAVVGYITGGKKGGEMISWANRLLSYDDTWTLPENSSYYQGLFLREMLRVALYSNRMTIPDEDSWGVAWKPNFIRQIEWIISTFPQNGFNPSYGEDYRQNYINHYMAPLVVATTVLDDGDPDHIDLAGEARWLLQKMFNYGITHEVSPFGENGYGYEAQQWGPFAVFLNPVYLYWYLNEGVVPVQPGIGGHTPSRAIYRSMSPEGKIESVYDESLSTFQTQPDKFIHRSGWGKNEFYLMLDPAYPAAKSGGNKYSFANNVVSLSYGPEEFLTGVTMNAFNTEKTRYNLADILSSYVGAELVSWSNESSLSRSVTRLKDGKDTWTREITLYKTGDRRIEVKDILSRRGSVYWHFQGFPQWQDNGVLLDVDDTRLQVTWQGAERFTHHNRTSWSETDPDKRWCYTGDPDREVKLYRSTPGVITTVFRGL
ncbi:MAG: lamin tail domain-containing protein, partial [Candidatus Auribacterota bacterium]|nr:lamin tail domain-containing protein [Candidatus Auribacterota bacterium]